jgi:mRNA-degrading endonuclease RelE of RelBE toxin-antitoxin system
VTAVRTRPRGLTPQEVRENPDEARGPVRAQCEFREVPSCIQVAEDHLHLAHHQLEEVDTLVEDRQDALLDRPGEAQVEHVDRKILSVVRKVLAEQPTLERRSRVKRMRAEFYPPYRLRVGDFRVYYDVDERRSEVLVLHVWEKGRQSTPHMVGPIRGRKR